MRILANENVPGDAVAGLRGHGHDVAWIREDAPGSPDPVVLARAQAESRILVTFDKDFGELAYRQRLPASCGVILFRFAVPSPAAAARRIVTALESRSDWTGHYAVIDDARIRITPLPAAPGTVS
jgi:predicted nuclease of predicted toxin-antitoxin system